MNPLDAIKQIIKGDKMFELKNIVKNYKTTVENRSVKRY